MGQVAIIAMEKPSEFEGFAFDIFAQGVLIYSGKYAITSALLSNSHHSQTQYTELCKHFYTDIFQGHIKI